MYALNGIDLSDWNIIPGQAPGSNIAISGHLDMPARIGDVFHDWGDEDGVEALTDAADIIFGGRDIHFHGLIMATDRESATEQVEAFQAYLSTLTDLVPFTSEYGEWQVYVKDKVEVQWIVAGWMTIKVTFREPVVDLGSGIFDETFDETFD